MNEQTHVSFADEPLADNDMLTNKGGYRSLVEDLASILERTGSTFSTVNSNDNNCYLLCYLYSYVLFIVLSLCV